MIRRDSRNRGSVLLVCIGILVVMAVMAAGFIAAITVERRASSNAFIRDYAKAAAETGLENAIIALKTYEPDNSYPTQRFNTSNPSLSYCERVELAISDANSSATQSTAAMTPATAEDRVLAPFLFQYFDSGVPTSGNGYLGRSLSKDDLYDSFGHPGDAYYVITNRYDNDWKPSSDVASRYQVRFAVSMLDLSGSMYAFRGSDNTPDVVYARASNFFDSIRDCSSYMFDAYNGGASATLDRASIYEANANGPTAGGANYRNLPSFRFYMNSAGVYLNTLEDVKYSMLCSPFQNNARVNILTAPPAVLRAVAFGINTKLVSSNGKILIPTVPTSSTSDVFDILPAMDYPDASSADKGTYTPLSVQEGSVPNYTPAQYTFSDGSHTYYLIRSAYTANSADNLNYSYYHEAIMALFKTIAQWRDSTYSVSSRQTSDFVSDWKANLDSSTAIMKDADVDSANPTATAADKNALKAKQRVKEMVLNNAITTWFGSTYRIDFNNDGTKQVSNWSVGLDPVVPDPVVDGKTLTGQFYVGKSQFFRIMVRGEVYDSTNTKVIAESNLESVYYMHYKDPTDLSSVAALGYNETKNHKLYQRWVFNKVSDGKF